MRTSNQDQSAVVLGPSLPEGFDGLIVVADGMGGEQGGAVASQMTVDILRNFFDPQTWGNGLASDADSTLRLLTEALQAANSSVYAAGSTDPSLKGMGTTCTAILAADSDIFIGHVGDSRAYIIRDGRAFLLTDDHSWVAAEVRRGGLTPEEAERHPQKNLLLRAIGAAPRIEVDTRAYRVHANDILLVCSDGLTNMVSADEIAEITMTSTAPDDVCSRLIDLANDRGGVDNVTAVVAQPMDIPGGATPGQLAQTAGATLSDTQTLPLLPRRRHTGPTFLNFLFEEPVFTILSYVLPGLLVGCALTLIVLRWTGHV